MYLHGGYLFPSMERLPESLALVNKQIASSRASGGLIFMPEMLRASGGSAETPPIQRSRRGGELPGKP